jgi:hypothetical protein
MLEDTWTVSMKIALSTKWSTTEIMLPLDLFFSTQALLKNRVTCVNAKNWQKLDQARQVGQTGSLGRFDRDALLPIQHKPARRSRPDHPES